jgi:plasmid stabilization system protein ParE
MKLRVSRKAVREATRIAADLGELDPLMARRFLDRLEEAWRLLRRFPEIGRLRRFRDPRLAAVRSWQLRRFKNCLVFYRVNTGAVEIVGIIHAARDLARALKEEIQERLPP